MSDKVGITASSQLKSANATSEIENHSGKKNRGKYQHANEDIDHSKSHLNEEIDLYDKEALLQQHYGELIEKHNKQNNSKARRWDMEKFLATFEGKKVKAGGKQTNNERWATASQISYLGGKDSLNPVLEQIEDAGASQEEIRDAYTAGYANYVDAHNVEFPTLPIYHSDVHFDETTPHGHDAIVVMGHTKKGRPSDSINNALGEIYGYGNNKGNMERYREANDGLIVMEVGGKLQDLAKTYGLDLEFKAIRTGDYEAVNYKEYKRLKEEEAREGELQHWEDGLITVTNKMNEHNREADRELNEREEGLNAREAQISARESDFAHQKRLQEEREKEQEQREQELDRLKAEANHDKALGQKMFADGYRQKNGLSELEEEKEKPTPKELNKILKDRTNGRFGLRPDKKTKQPRLADLEIRKFIPEKQLIDALGERETDEQGNNYVNIRGNGEIQYVLGHYRSKDPKTPTEAIGDGMEKVASAAQELELEKTQDKAL